MGLQGADDRARPGGRLRPRSRRAAHLAAGRLDDDRPAQPRPHASPPRCSGRSTGRPGSPGSTTPAAIRARFDRDYPDATELFDGPRRRVRPQPGRLAGHRPRVAVGARPAGAARRRRPRHRPVLRPGHELRLRGRRRARPLPRRVRRRLGGSAGRCTPSGASRTPTPSPSWRSTTSSRCATRSARRCSGSASGSSTPSSAGRPSTSSRCTSWSASRPCRTPRPAGGPRPSAGSRPTSPPSAAAGAAGPSTGAQLVADR